MKRIAFFGGSFDPVHNGHMSIAQNLASIFELDEFVFIPAFHAPHKPDRKPTSAYDRYAMLSLATQDEPRTTVSKIELELPEKPYTVETLERLKIDYPDTQIFFVMGADSWMDILTWREWEKVLTTVSHIVVTRPGYEIGFDHVTDEIRERIRDVRGSKSLPANDSQLTTHDSYIYISDAVLLDVSATSLRRNIRESGEGWQSQVPAGVANYIEKYQIYK
jgi:nicotinate-nucleotide adenylyltransferase